MKQKKVGLKSAEHKEYLAWVGVSKQEYEAYKAVAENKEILLKAKSMVKAIEAVARALPEVKAVEVIYDAAWKAYLFKTRLLACVKVRAQETVYEDGTCDAGKPGKPGKPGKQKKTVSQVIKACYVTKSKTCRFVRSAEYVKHDIDAAVKDCFESPIVRLREALERKVYEWRELNA